MPLDVEHRTKREGTLSGCQKTTTTLVTSPTASVRHGAILDADEPRQYRAGGDGPGGVHGSGPRANVFSNVTGPVLPSARGSGNRIVLFGDEAEFARSNPGIEPIPPCGCWKPRR